jgi:hypothetical protein
LCSISEIESSSWLAADRAAHVLLHARDLELPLVDLRLELVAHVEDARDGLLELAVLARAVLDRLLVDGGGIARARRAAASSELVRTR